MEDTCMGREHPIKKLVRGKREQMKNKKDFNENNKKCESKF